MKFSIRLVAVVIILTITLLSVYATSDEILNDFFKMYADTFKIEPILAVQVQTPDGKDATLSLVKLSWVDKEGNKNTEKRFYANYKGAKHFSDGQNIEIAKEYPSGKCKFEGPDKSCSVTHVDFMFLNKHENQQYQFYRFNFEVEPNSGNVKSANAKEIVVDETKTVGKKWDIEDKDVTIENVQVPLTIVQQNGILTENVALEYIQVG